MDEMMRPKVYISGPLTSSGDPQANLSKAIEIAREMIHMGLAPLCPHLTWYIDPNAEIEHSVWMEVDLPWVRKSNAVFRMPGKSRGAEIEVSEAITRGIPVFTTLEELHDHFKALGKI